ncbi:complement component C9 [Xyrichtys novacula]|uniref:Complement component C9 n=1 Tax=Xyrichtys novacula TaxID=13765 RepID=A0AAV1GAB1_XYRNO|nr:complement component C9 [Xyrichtys novacula]
MRSVVALQLGFCGLCLTVALIGEGMAVVLPDPPAVNCVWSRWSEWSSCNPCTRTRGRSRSVETFGQFGGQSCHGSIGDREVCVTDTQCDQPPSPECSALEFQCESGTCVKKRLVCNGDYDCEDGSDEDCDNARSICQPPLENNEQGRTAGYGTNLLGADPRMNPFNNDFFNGRCDRVRNPNTGRFDRLPWNIGVLNYQTMVEETISREIYEDTHSLLREMLKEMTSKLDIGLSFKLSLSEETMSNKSPDKSGLDNQAGVSPSLDLTSQFEKKEMIKEISEYSNVKNKSFMRVKGRVQLSTYRLRSLNVQVAEDFLLHVKSLPLEYEKGIYFAFLEDYGTHYTKNGKSGGEYEFIYVLNQDSIKAKNITMRTIQECVRMGITADLGITGVTVDRDTTHDPNPNPNPNPDPNRKTTSDSKLKGHVKSDNCEDVTNKEEGSIYGKAVVDRVMTSVKGGDLQSAVVMRAKLNKDGVMDIDTYQNWARSIADAPALIYSEPEPIYNLIPIDMPGANARITNLRRATTDYEAEYSVCKCRPCHNGGTLTLLNGKCMCLCPHLFEGLACQNFKGDKADSPGGRPDVNEEGNWSCWSSWSNCSGEKRRRTRGCNTEGLLGAVCRGDTDSEEYC